MAEEICSHCGAVLDGVVEYELPDGSRRGRCSVCRRPYVVPDGDTDPGPESELEGAPDPEDESEPEIDPEAEPAIEE